MLTMGILRWINFYESLQKVVNKPMSLQKGIFQILLWLPGVANKMMIKKNEMYPHVVRITMAAIKIHGKVTPMHVIHI